MEIKIKIADEISDEQNLLLLISSVNELQKYKLSTKEIGFIKSSLKNKNTFSSINQYKRWIFVQMVPEKKEPSELLEALRRDASKLKSILNSCQINELLITGMKQGKEKILAYLEGILLSHYSFTKYFTDKEKNENTLAQIFLHNSGLSKENIQELEVLMKSVYLARTLINEPLSYLDTKKLCDELKKESKNSGLSWEILGKKQLQSLKMGGILAVNQGSSSDPAFVILSWKPENAKNKKPIVLVGKGIVYDTGGLSLKPTPDSMDYMKSDMGGAATVAASIIAIARMKLPVYAVALIPVTDNAIGNNAYVPGDVITMHNKKTVEVLNTDAEGRLILADALSYALKFKPELVIDVATLTGAAAMAFGHYAMAVMGNISEIIFKQLELSSKKTSERMVRLPLYEDYQELLKSDIADLKNIGGRVAGAITAGKFLEAFTDYPWIHMDIAGPAWIQKDFHYLTKGGTGFGIRLLVDFIRNYK